MFGLSISRLVIGAVGGAVLVAGLFWAGNIWGPNAHWKANRQAEDAAKNAVLTDLIENDKSLAADEEGRFAKADAEFAKVRPTLTQCLLSASAATELNKVRE